MAPCPMCGLVLEPRGLAGHMAANSCETPRPRRVAQHAPEPEDIRWQGWRDRAVCKGSTDRVWVTAPHLSDPDAVEAALWTCARCPVARDCRAVAGADRHFEGVAGGAAWVDANTALHRKDRRRVVMELETASA